MPWLSCIISNVVLASLVALAAWFAQRRLGRPALARTLWVLVLVKLVTPPLVNVPLRGSPGIMACALGACGCEHHAQTMARGTLPWVLLLVWSAGAGTTGWTAWRRWTRFRRLMAHASPAPPEWQTLAARVSTDLSIRRPPEILAMPGRLPPLVVAGRRRPSMLLPMALMGRLNASQREALLLHELVHIQRGDHVVRILELTVSVAYWWLPIVGSIGRQLRACEEACCDAAVVARLPQARRDYAELLLDVVDFANPLPQQAVPQATAMSAAHDLEQRLRAILDATQGTRRRWPAGMFATGTFATGAFATGKFATGAFVTALACALLPCELHFDFVGRQAPAATSEECGPAAGATCLPSSNRETKPSLDLCCPS